MNLRAWQKEAITQCLSHFSAGHEHFLCLATPGAGKTYMASNVAKRLLDSGEIDLVFCFSPSVNIAHSFQYSLESMLGYRLDGFLGAKGQVLTYQAMLHLEDSFWKILDKQRSLVIFDEIHHCAGDSPMNANAWGQKIIQRIQGQATYTLALTGTPWRSDRIPISLTSYCRAGKVHCDYSYGLSQAIADGVCRSPLITGIDNSKITVVKDRQENRFKSFEDLLASSQCNYQQLIQNTKLIRHLLKVSQKKLAGIRRNSPDAGGLIVTASVQHAEKVASILEFETGERATVVTYQHEDSQRAIQLFRGASSPWIISVGMISEGTDIPRLQVCCHLTRVKTELYFRQVLGRILRVRSNPSETAALFMPAEPKLMDFAKRIMEDVPESRGVIKEMMESDLCGLDDMSVGAEAGLSVSHIGDEKLTSPVIIEGADQLGEAGDTATSLSTTRLTSLADAYENTLGLFGRFKERVVRLNPKIG